MQIVLLESLGVSDTYIDALAAPLREQGHQFVRYSDRGDAAAQMERAKNADVLMIANMPLSGEIIRGAGALKYIDVAFTGVDHVDLAAAKERGVQVSNASGYSTICVAELALGMMLSLLRNLPQVEARLRGGQTKDGLVGRELRGKTVGIVGLGAIGMQTAQLCMAFGANVIAYSRSAKPAAAELGIRQVSLEALLAESDIVSLHCPLTPDTAGLISAKRLAMMKPSALLVNTARGPVVDSRALADALNGGRIAGAAIDVFETEPPIASDHPLLGAKNAILTPHVAFATTESLQRRADIVFENLFQWLAGNQLNTIL